LPYVQAQQALASPKSITLEGITHTEAQTMVRVAEGNERQPPPLSAGAVRAARHRLKKLLAQHGNPPLLLASKVLRGLRALSNFAEAEEKPLWQAGIEEYRAAHGLAYEEAPINAVPRM